MDEVRPDRFGRTKGQRVMIKLILLSVLLSGVAAFAQIQQRSPLSHRILALGANLQYQPANVASRMFVEQASKGGIYGLLLGIVGVERSGNPDVKTFAENLIRENQIINSELTSIAQVKGVSTPKALDVGQRDTIQRLSQLSGQDFDSTFLEAALAEHLDMLRVFQEEAQAGKDQDIQRFAFNAVPKLRHYFDLGKKTQAGLETRD